MDKILMTYVILIKKGEITLDQIPEAWREKVESEMVNMSSSWSE